jgi:maltose O-acetyltransferase
MRETSQNELKGTQNNVLFYPQIRRIYYFLKRKKKEKYLRDLVNKGLTLGQNVGIVDSFFFDPSHCFLISIGRNCIICPNVRLIAHDASTKKMLGYTKIGKIDIGENCFIGDSAIILPGVRIGPNTIIASGSVVTRGEYPSSSVIAGNPAKVLMTVDKYLEKVNNMRKNKKIYNEDWYIDELDEVKRKEILDSIGDGIGFIL